MKNLKNGERNTGMLKGDDTFSTISAIVNLDPKRGTQWLCFVDDF